MPREIFAQHLQPFAGHRRLEAGEARYVGPWVCDVGHEPAAFGIRDLDEDDRNRIGRPLQGQSARCGMRDNHIGGKRHQLLGEGGDAIRTSRRPAVVDAQIASIDPSQGLQAVVQPGDHQLRLLIAFADARQDRDPPHALLSARRQWPRHRRSAECGQQFPPSDGDCHTPLPCEVRKGNDTMPRACCPNSAAGLAHATLAPQPKRRLTRRTFRARSALD
jgi:hypothetical protein